MVNAPYLPPSLPLPFGPTAVGVALAGGGWLLVGWTVEETSGASAARLVIRDGMTANGEYRVPITLAPNESARDDVLSLRLKMQSGVFIDVTAGSVAGTIFVIPLDQLPPEQSTPGPGLTAGMQ